MKSFIIILIACLSLAQLHAQEVPQKQIDQLKKDLAEKFGKKADQIDISILSLESYKKHKELLDVLQKIKFPFDFNEDSISISMYPGATEINDTIEGNKRLIVLPSDLPLKNFYYNFSQNIEEEPITLNLIREKGAKSSQILSKYLPLKEVEAHIAMLNSTCMKGPSNKTSLMIDQNRKQLVQNLAKATKSREQDFESSAHFNYASLFQNNPIGVFAQKKSGKTYVVEQKRSSDNAFISTSTFTWIKEIG